MFRRISNTIALRFTAFVFVLLLINGALFLLADLGNARREMHMRLQRNAHAILEFARFGSMDFPHFLPPPVRERVRIVDASGNTLYSGGVFAEVPVSLEQGISETVIQGDRYSVLTIPILSDDSVESFLQVAEVQRLPVAGLPFRIALYLLVSVGISAVTFAVGQYFARTSLRPAEDAMQRLEQFTQDASHELRTPLASLNSSLDLALRTKNYEKGILSAKEDLQEVSSLVERLLELARLDRLVLSPSLVDASELMASIVDRHREAAMKRSVTIALHAAPDVRVHADAALLRQLVSNLLTNAMKFSKSEGGTVDVTLSGERLVISDNGIGIASEHLAHIFDRFYQADTSRSEDGYGLGLALVKRIADLHQWTVHADSTYGKGSVFTVNFVAQHKRRAS